MPKMIVDGNLLLRQIAMAGQLTPPKAARDDYNGLLDMLHDIAHAVINDETVTIVPPDSTVPTYLVDCDTWENQADPIA